MLSPATWPSENEPMGKLASRIGSIEATFPPSPKGAKVSRAFASSDGVVVGVAGRAGGKQSPVLWRGEAASALVVDGKKDLSASGAGGGRVVGSWNASGRRFVSHPVAWSIADGSVVELDMKGYESAGARACTAAAAVGWGKVDDDVTRALLWRNRGAPVVLDCPGDRAFAESVHGDDVGGYAGSAGRQRAVLWRSGACVDLTPKDSAAQVACVDDGVQVGVVFAYPGARAVRWRSSADSLVDLTPDGHEVAQALGVDGDIACGFARVKAKGANGLSDAHDDKAVLFGDDKDDVVELPVPAQFRFTSSAAWCIRRDGSDVIVVGTAREHVNDMLSQERAIVWRFKVKP